MNTVREFAADDAHIIFGAVYDNMGDRFRVTVVATGLGQAQAEAPDLRGDQSPVLQATRHARCRAMASPTVNHDALDTPAIIRKRPGTTVEAPGEQRVVDRYDIPAFLRKQAD